MFPGLPQPPQTGGPSQGVRPQPLYGPGAPFQQPIGSQVAQGIDAFVTNYIAAKDARQAKFRQKFFDSLQLIQAGLGSRIDLETVAKYAKKGNIPLNFDEPSPQEIDRQKMVNDKENAMQLALQGGALPGLPPGTDQMAMNAATQPVPQAAPAQQPGFWQRAMNAIRPQPVSPASPGMDWLKQYGAATAPYGGLTPQVAEQEGQLTQLSRNIRGMMGTTQTLQQGQLQKLLGIAKEATNPDSPMQGQAIEMLVRSGMMKDLPIDEITTATRYANPGLTNSDIKQRAGSLYMWTKMGGPQLRIQMLKMAQDLAPEFGNSIEMAQRYLFDIFNRGQSDVRPAWSPEQYEKLMQGTTKLFDAYPTAPANLVGATAMAAVTPNGQAAHAKMMEVLSAYPRSGTMDVQKQQRQLGFDYWSTGQRLELERENLKLSQLRAIGEHDQELMNKLMQIRTNPAAYPDEVNAATGLMNQLFQKESTIKYKYNGQEYTMAPKTVMDFVQRPGWLLSGGKGYLSPVQVPQGAMGPQAQPQAPGQQAQPNFLGQLGLMQSLMGLSPEEQQAILAKVGGQY